MALVTSVVGYGNLECLPKMQLSQIGRNNFKWGNPWPYYKCA
jgi:hypothetical protein